MHITFHGAARNVTGSKHMVQLNDGTNILLDCGMFQGLYNADDLNGHFGFNPKKVDYLILSHAHIDHCGLIPRLVKEGFEGQIFSTPATMNLARILMADSARIQTSDAEYANSYRERKGLPLEDPMYTEEDAMAAMSLFKVVEYNEDYEISPRVKVRFTDAGHVIGSAAVHLTILEDGKYTQITFSGDVGRYGDLILRSPQPFPQADYILLESTYGDSLHKDLKPIATALHDIIQHTCNVRHGKVIIPAFSVGRTQELLFALNSLELDGKLPDVPYYVDSPLADQATQVLKDHPEEYNKGVTEIMKVDADPFSFKGLRFVQSTEESIALNNDPRPCVIISSSGMAEAGRVRHHIRNNIGQEKNTILIVGYCEPSSLGGHLLAGDRVVNIFHEDYDVKCEVKSIKSMSAHGDYEDLLKFMSCQDPAQVKKVFLVHGEFETQKHFAQKLENVGFKNVEIPYQHQRVELGNEEAPATEEPSAA
ncbi:MBL fold metallo-hydrolase RNA specificity domain-containing protein [Mucilaginibacter sp. KACC 22063]|uniref:MBL fold metallo-hydrolase RNA specificity domain-containing protein n=1 Tax=Mucilaginibacter sp. KACC 22063 TaxID=3025666 RepID=UPI0023657942|nr:MBL fold metallo-hydrolase [Mucilaginibacter sp. KACC 22063]WDF56086.1 MBL fold metallo-hydrolase [Mucilaginibacter sp. KACC 22063]